MLRYYVCLLLILIFCGRAHAQEPASWALLPFNKVDSANPVWKPDSTLVFTDPNWNKQVRWAKKDVFNPATVVKGDTLFMLFRAEDTVGKYAGVSRVGLAWSLDGLKFTSLPNPVLYPMPDRFRQWEWEGGCEDPRVVQDAKGTYIMTYTAYDGTTARLMVASSPDLRNWTKHGPAFGTGVYAKRWSKSGAIASRYHADGRVVAERIQGRYWMYFGDVNIWAATSTDLIHWTPQLYPAGAKRYAPLRRNADEWDDTRTVFGPRNKHFDSDLVEPGPPAMITDRGIVLLYNGRNLPAIGDSTLAEGAYASGQVLISKTDPTKVLARLPRYFLKPDRPYEINGQVNHVCFIEGLARYKGKWFLYYGTADSQIAVAVH